MRSSAFICGFIVLIAGCCPKTTREPYYGPTLPMREVVQRINANNELVATLWAGTDFKLKAQIDGRDVSVGGSGVLLYRRPGELRITGKHPLAGPIFDIVSSNDRYGMIVKREETAWWGYHQNADKPCSRPLPIRPDLLVEMIGISTFNTNFLEEPVPVMRFNHDEDRYVFVWHVRLADRWAAMKEVWYDRETIQPRRVILFDANGRTILRAELDHPKPIETPELPKEKWPLVATSYRISFPESKAELDLTFDEVKPSNDGAPNKITFRMPAEGKWGVANVIQVDQDCDD